MEGARGAAPAVESERAVGVFLMDAERFSLAVHGLSGATLCREADGRTSAAKTATLYNGGAGASKAAGCRTHDRIRANDHGSGGSGRWRGWALSVQSYSRRSDSIGASDRNHS